MKKNFIFVLIAMLTISNFVFAADWVQIDEKLYLDASSLRPYTYNLNFNNDRLYSIWEKDLNDGKKSWKDLEKSSKKKLWYGKYLSIVNCTRKEIATKSMAFYDINENVTFTYDYTSLDWRSVIPETVGELKYNIVCSAVTPNVSNSTTSSRNNIITTPDGTNIRVKYHKKRTLFNNR